MMQTDCNIKDSRLLCLNSWPIVIQNPSAQQIRHNGDMKSSVQSTEITNNKTRDNYVMPAIKNKKLPSTSGEHTHQHQPLTINSTTAERVISTQQEGSTTPVLSPKTEEVLLPILCFFYQDHHWEHPHHLHEMGCYTHILELSSTISPLHC